MHMMATGMLRRALLAFCSGAPGVSASLSRDPVLSKLLPWLEISDPDKFAAQSLDGWGVDIQAWTAPFTELTLLELVGEGSFGRVSSACFALLEASSFVLCRRATHMSRAGSKNAFM